MYLSKYMPPYPRLTEPLSPWVKFFLVTMFMIPPPPAASYLEDGWAMISIRSIVVPSVELSRTSSSLPERLDGRPSSHTATVEPLSLTLPSKSMVTPGALRSRSVPLLPSVETASETFMTILSSFCSMTGRRAETTTASSISASGSMLTVPMSEPFPLRSDR